MQETDVEKPVQWRTGFLEFICVRNRYELRLYMVNGHDGQRHAGYESGELFRFFHHAVFDPFAKDAAEGIDQGNGP